MRTTSNRGFMPQLDGIRAIAVAMVAIHHWHHPSMFGNLFPLDSGVDIFFVLSGFLIMQILLGVRDRIDLVEGSRRRAQLVALKAFWVRRFLRLVPALVLYVALASALGYFEDVRGIFWYLGYLGNWRIGQLGFWPQGGAHLWSLAVEEQFYILMPLVAFWLPRRFLTGFFTLGIALSVVATAIGDSSSNLLPPAAFTGLFIGCVTALFFDRHGESERLASLSRMGAPAVVAAVAIGPLLPRTELARISLDFSLNVAAAVLTWRAALGIGHKVLESPLMAYLGRVSYGIYLWHFVALFITIGMVGESAPWVLRLALSTLITLLFAYASDKYFEQRFTARKVNHPYIPRAEPKREGTGGTLKPQATS